MSEQSGRSEPADGQRPDKRPGGEPSRTGRTHQARQSEQCQPRVDPVGDLQRWLIRSSARSMRSQLEDQVRRTLGRPRQEKGDVWDVATTEIPPEVGEAPECQWCPICRAARRMRDSGPGIAGQLSGAGDVVASAVQEAVRTLDSLLGKAGGSGQDRGQSAQPGDAAASATTRATPDGAATDARTEGAAGQRHVEQPDAAARPDSLAGEHGPVGWKPGDRLATTDVATADPWETATAPGEGADGANPGNGTTGPDGRGHGPSDRG